MDRIIYRILDESEIGLGITWKNGKFIPTGAALLDQSLVNEVTVFSYSALSTHYKVIKNLYYYALVQESVHEL